MVSTLGSARRRAARKQKLSREATLFRIALYARVRGVEAACSLTLRELGRLTETDVRSVAAFVRATENSRSAGPWALVLERALEKNA